MIGYVAANDGTISAPEATSSVLLMQNSGENLGNLAFWYATRRMFTNKTTLVHWRPLNATEKIEALVIPAANFLGVSGDLTPLTEMIRSLDVPCVLVGLGAQSENENTLPTIYASVLPFLKEVAKRTPYIGVRGEYSARVCRELGILNVRVLGCPSILINGDQNLGAKVAKRIAELQPESIAVHAACTKGSLINVERELVGYIRRHPGSVYVVQRPEGLIAPIFQEELTPEGAKLVARTANFLGFRGADEFKLFLRRFGYAPTGIDSWAALMLRFSCSINTRIHGTIIATQAGIPSLCICHDTRTTELAACLRLPAVSISEFIGGRYDIRRLFLSREFDGAVFDGGRKQIAQECVALFKKVGLTISPHLLAFTRDNSATQAA